MVAPPGRAAGERHRGEGNRVDGEVLRRLIGEAGAGGVRVRDLSGRTGAATAMRGGLAVVSYPDGVERLDPAWLAWAGTPTRATGREVPVAQRQAVATDR